MTRPKRTKPDGNQAEIVKDLRSLGFDVDIVCDLPGLYDLVVSGERRTLPGQCSVRVEVKATGAMLSDNELIYYELQRHPESYIVARSTEDVLEWFQR